MPPRQLRQGLDRDVYHIVRKFEDSGAYKKLTVTTVYEAIKASNSSLARQKRRPLEDSIERVLDVRKEEEQEAADGDGLDSDAALEAELARTRDARAEKDASLLNRQLTKHWNFSAAKTKPDYPTGISASGEMDIDQPAGAERLTNGEPKAKRRRRAPTAEPAMAREPPTGISTADMAGMEDVLERLINPVWVPLCEGENMASLGGSFDNAVLLHGPSGCGKTSLANCIAGDLGVAYIPISGPSIVAGTSGESEKNIRDCFDEALRLAPCFVFIDEIDSIAGKRDSSAKAMEGRIVAELCACMDKIGMQAAPGKNVVVLAATNKPESLDHVVRRRFGVEVDIGMPSEEARGKILARMLKDVELDDDVDLQVLAKLTPGFVGSDLKRVVQAAMERVSRSLWERRLDAALTPGAPRPTASVGWSMLRGTPSLPAADINMRINLAHLKAAVASVQPAARREGFSTIPDTTWAHVGALHDVRRQMETSIMGPIRDPSLYAQVGIEPAAGILLWGPPGCGKTLVAKAVANESKANFISIKGPEILSKYVGESERAVRSLFSRARSSAPCILFFDEMDALVPTRGDSLNDSSGRLVNALLTELDGVGDRKGIYVIGATNRPDVIDPAIRRPGRLGTSIFVGLPTPADRAEILKTIYRNKIKLNEVTENDRSRRMIEVEIVARDRRCDGFSGADLGNLMQAAGKHCLERVGLAVGSSVVITMADWNKALDEIKPSVRDMHKYEALAE